MEKPEYEWTVGDIKFQVWEQARVYSLHPRLAEFACKVLHDGGHEWLERTDSVSGCAFHAMTWLEDNIAEVRR